MFAQHSNAATSLAPILLSCTARIQDKSVPNGRLRALPDWSVISDDNQRIQGYLFYGKTLGYQHQDSDNAPPAAHTILTPVPYVSLLLPPTVVAPTLAPFSLKHGLFVPRNSKKQMATSSALEAELDVEVAKPTPVLPKPRPVSETRIEAGRALPRPRP